MKKLVLLFLGGILLASCGDKKKETTETAVDQEVVVKDNYSIVFLAIYEKDDELSLQFKKDDGFMDYDHPIKYKIKGQPTIQRFSIEIPSGVALANFQFYLSTNKEQKNVQLKAIIVSNNGKEVFNGDNFEYLKYFNGNAGVIMDEKNQRFNLNFDGKFPPGFTGNEQLESMLVK